MPKYWMLNHRSESAVGLDFSSDGTIIYGAYFLTDSTLNLMRHLLRGFDRGVPGTPNDTKRTASP
jgi:hypothetical protein